MFNYLKTTSLAIAAAVKNSGASHAPDSAVQHPSARESLISAGYLGRWGNTDAGHERLEIVSTDSGLVEVELRIIQKEKTWVSKEERSDVDSGSVRLEISYIVQMVKSNAQGAKQLDLGQFKEINAALIEFNRLADSLVDEYFPGQSRKIAARPNASKTASQTLEFKANDHAVTRAPFGLKRIAKALFPWFGGAAIVITYALWTTGPNAAMKNAAQAGITPEMAAKAQESWVNLKPEQQQALLNMVGRAANQVYEENTGMAPASQAPASTAPPAAADANAAIAASLAAAAAAQKAGGPKSALPPDIQALIDAQSPARTLSKAEVSKIKSAVTIQYGKGPNVFYVFEDPNCSSCKHFARQAKALDDSFTMVVVPVGFQPGGKDRAAAALCANDPVAAFAKAMQSSPYTEKSCEAGLKAVDKNNDLFASMNFDSTPTLVAANGAMMIGSGDTSQIAQWVIKNAR
jgi:protein-disulfide isomerase